LFGTSAFDHWCARQIGRKESLRAKKVFLTLSVCSNIGVLFAFKYFVFFFNTSVETFHLPAALLQNLVIPAGLSFYTFQSLGYAIDVYRGKYPPSDTLYEFLLYVSFFPHMVAGPIVRYADLMPQFKIIHYFKNINWKSFATLTIWGYFKKIVIADNLADLVNPVFANVTAYNSIELLFAGFLFVVQVYCDFSGYSDIATGISKLFGINLTLNWRRPLLSRSLREFWNRNHISITTWFRDYLYISLGGNRVSYSRWLFNIFLVFFISGLWHGANFTFLIWGAMHGLLYILEISVNKKFPTFKAPAFLGWIYLMSFHTISLIAFRSVSVADLGYIYKHLFCDVDIQGGLDGIIALKDRLYFYICLLLVGFLFAKEYSEEHAGFEELKGSLRPWFYVMLVICIFVLGNFNANEFIYFQF
ncbi:MAG: MBOAT family O-acyltransferase, partial [Bacteroidia bacterium]